jgi:hypothetical protein
MKDKLVNIILVAAFLLLSIVILERAIFITNKPQAKTSNILVKIAIVNKGNLKQSSVSSVKELYLNNNLFTTEVDSIVTQDNRLVVTLKGQGVLREDVGYLGAQRIALNQRISIHGLIDGEGIVISFQKY